LLSEEEVAQLEAENTRLMNEINELTAKIKREFPRLENTIEDLNEETKDLTLWQERLEIKRDHPDAISYTVEQLEAEIKQHEEQVNRLKSAFGKKDSMTINSTRAPADYVVAVQRLESAVEMVTYYFPYELANSGLAGEIPLHEGDLVQVLDLRQVLKDRLSQAVPATQDFILQGFVRGPGMKRVKSGMTRLDDIASALPPITDGSGVLTLVRNSADGMGKDVFVFPADMIHASNEMSQLRILGGDTYTYTRLPLVPIILQSLTEKALGGPQTGPLRPRLSRAQERLASHTDRRDERIQQAIEDAGPLRSQLLRNCRELRQTLGNRFDGLVPGR
jgi:hypothetical protein